MPKQAHLNARDRQRLEVLEPVLFRTQRFKKFADSLEPTHWERPIKEELLPLIEKVAKPIWPDCMVRLHGSVARRVHNRYDSDIDIAIDTGGVPCYEREMFDFRDEVGNNQGLRLMNKFGKTLKFSFRFICKGSETRTLHYPEVNVDVAFQRRFRDPFHSREFINELDRVYKRHPEVQQAARVAKYAFAEMKGLDVEFLICQSFDQRQRMHIQDQDSSGFSLFWDVLLSVSHFSVSTSNAPYQYHRLMEKARAQPGADVLNKLQAALEVSEHFAQNLIDLYKERHHQRKTVQKAQPLVAPAPRPTGDVAAQATVDVPVFLLFCVALFWSNAPLAKSLSLISKL